MVKATQKDSASNEAEADTEEVAGPRIIAEWVGNDFSPRIDGATSRHLTKKEVEDGLIMTTTRDLSWTAATAYRADISAEPEAFQEWLRKQSEFKVTEE